MPRTLGGVLNSWKPAGFGSATAAGAGGVRRLRGARRGRSGRRRWRRRLDLGRRLLDNVLRQGRLGNVDVGDFLEVVDDRLGFSGVWCGRPDDAGEECNVSGNRARDHGRAPKL
jgi:hypothetical protein